MKIQHLGSGAKLPVSVPHISSVLPSGFLIEIISLYLCLPEMGQIIVPTS